MNYWWGYLHVNGAVIVKVLFDERDIEDAMESSFVAQVVDPFECDSRQDAIIKVKEYLAWKEKFT